MERFISFCQTVRLCFLKGGQAGPDVRLEIRDPAFFDSVIAKSDIGLGESYIDGLWTTNSISKLIEFSILNKEPLRAAMVGQWHRILFYKLKHTLNFNSKNGSKRNISAHYDLGNSFYSLWLDPSMTYSSAYWGDYSSLSLQEAQENKYALLLNSLEAKPGQHILEIGCGWGGFAEHAAKRGYRVTAITISQEQFWFASDRMQRLGLDRLVEIRLIDYRELDGEFDHIVSIEMLEAVGETYWSVYFEKVKTLLRPGGNAAIQTITINNESFSQYRKGTDFIQQYIFPGGMLPCERKLNQLASKANLKVMNSVAFGQDYARTLSEWNQAFLGQIEKVRNLGFPQSFERMWRFYLEYCEGAFRSKHIDVILFKVRRPL